MSIEINNQLPITETNRPKNKASTEQMTSNTQATATSSDSVNLSIGSALDALKNVPSVDAERVAQLKAAIDNGSYEVNTANVAKNIIRSEQELNTG